MAAAFEGRVASASVRPRPTEATRLLFFTIVAGSCLTLILPLYSVGFSSEAWRLIGESFAGMPVERQLPARSIAQVFLTFYGLTLLGFFASTIWSYRRWLRRSLMIRRGVRGLRPLYDVSPALHEQLASDIRVTGELEAGRIELMVNDRTADSYVVASPTQSWIVLSLPDLVQVRQRVRFTVLHEFAHVVSGDHRMLGWVPSILGSAVMCYVVSIFSQRLFSIATTHTVESGLLVQDLYFLIYVIIQLALVKELLRRREVEADRLARAWMGSEWTEDLFSGTQQERTLLRTIRETWHFILGGPWHPPRIERQSGLAGAQRAAKPLDVLPWFAGFATMGFGLWGLVIPEIEAGIRYPQRRPQLAPIIEALQFSYPVRWVLFFVGALLVSLDVLRRSEVRAARLGLPRIMLWFWVGSITLLPVGALRDALEGMGFLGYVASGVASGALMAVYFGMVVLAIVTVLAADAKRRKHSQQTMPAWVGALPIVALLALQAIGLPTFSRTEPIAAAARMKAFLIITPIGMILIAILVGRVTLLRDALSKARGTFKMDVSGLGLGTVIGGMLGAAYMTAIPIWLLMQNVKGDKMAIAQSMVMAFFAMHIGEGALAGGIRWVRANVGKRGHGLVLALLVAGSCITGVPGWLPVLAMPCAVALGLERADAKRDQTAGWVRTLLWCAGMSLLMGIAIGVPAFTVMYLKGDSIGLVRGAVGVSSERLPIVPAVALEVVRLIDDTAIGALLTAVGVRLCERVMGGPARRSRETSVLVSATIV